MSKDYYKTLGISRNASTEEIKKAYRKLAMKYHPDRGGDHQKFKEANEAYQVLSNPQKRAQYDQFGTTADAAGFGGFEGSYGPSGFEDIFSGSTGFGFGRVNDIFEDFFGRAFSQIHVEVPITITQAVLGDEIKFKTQGGEEVELKIPAGTQDGQTFQFKNKGMAYRKGKGDLLATVRIRMPQKLSKEEKELYQKLHDLEKNKKEWWKF